MIRIIFLFISCFVAICIFADNTSTDTPIQTKDLKIVLHKQPDNKRLRLPAKNPTAQIIGEYTAAGILHLYADTDTHWTITISSTDITNTYYASTLELQDGIQIGLFTEFAITITNEFGEAFIGEFDRE